MANNPPVVFFGGTFNPPHLGHQLIVAYILSVMDVRRVVVVPCFSPPHKQENGLASFDDRLEMTKILFEDLSAQGKVEVSGIESRLPSPSFTWQTLRELRKIWPESPVCPVVGMDMYLGLSQWQNFEELRRDYRFIVLKRKDMICIPSGPDDKFLDNPYWNISSREIRDQLREYYQNPGKPREEALGKWLSPGLIRYIISRNLYKET